MRTSDKKMEMEISLKIKNGKFDLIASGIIISASKEPIIITINDDGEPIDIIMRFENNKAEINKISGIVKHVEGQNAIEIIFTNYNLILGSFTKEPWLIAESFNRDLYLLYVISGFTDSELKKIEYSFYFGLEVKKGKH